jgi:hypothetical protein
MAAVALQLSRKMPRTLAAKHELIENPQSEIDRSGSGAAAWRPLRTPIVRRSPVVHAPSVSPVIQMQTDVKSSTTALGAARSQSMVLIYS